MSQSGGTIPPKKIREITEQVNKIFGGPPRDPKRIPEVLERIKEIWTRCPDLRLTQLIGNCFKAEAGPKFYYTEDDDLVEKLDAMYKEVDVH